MSQGPPVGPLVVVGTPVQALVPVPPEPVVPPEPTVPPVEETSPSGRSAVTLQPKHEMPTIATTESLVPKLVLLMDRGVCRRAGIFVTVKCLDRTSGPISCRGSEAG